MTMRDEHPEFGEPEPTVPAPSDESASVQGEGGKR